MDLLNVIFVIIGLVMIYFLFGIIIKFILGWLPLIIGCIIGVAIGLQGGIGIAIIGIVVFIISLLITNNWQGSNLYFSIEEKIENIFYFKD